MSSWFTEFLRLSAAQWQADADHHQQLAEQARARGDLLVHAREDAQAMSYRRVAGAYRLNADTFTGATEDHEWDCTPADLDLVRTVDRDDFPAVLCEGVAA